MALLTLPISAFLWVVAPEFIPLVLGPAWGGVVTPFRLFSISLLFRMSSRISDTCTTAAGKVYSRAVLQGAYAVLVIVGAIIGQRWGISGVAIAVSVAMAFNWLSMAWLAGSVTGVSWGRFLAAHVHGAVLATAIWAAATAAAAASRGGHLPPIVTLLISGLAAVVVTLAVGRLWPDVFLGSHGRWSVGQLNNMFRRTRARSAAQSRPNDELAMEKASPK